MAPATHHLTKHISHCASTSFRKKTRVSPLAKTPAFCYEKPFHPELKTYLNQAFDAILLGGTAKLNSSHTMALVMELAATRERLNTCALNNNNPEKHVETDFRTLATAFSTGNVRPLLDLQKRKPIAELSLKPKDQIETSFDGGTVSYEWDGDKLQQKRTTEFGEEVLLQIGRYDAAGTFVTRKTPGSAPRLFYAGQIITINGSSKEPRQYCVEANGLLTPIESVQASQTAA